MKIILGCALIALPFAVLLVDFSIRRFNLWRYNRAVAKRNAQLRRFGLVPFPGTKGRI
jgi:hypothetical protein